MQVAADFGIGLSTLSKWIQQDRSNPEKPSAQSDLERTIVDLRKESRLPREEREVLKKATQFFANQRPWGINSCTAGQWMSGKRNLYDNATTKTFFKTIKAELIWWRPLQTRRAVELAIFEYTNGF